MREIRLTKRAQQSIHTLAPRGTAPREALRAVFSELEDDRVSLVRPEDFPVRHGSLIMGRPVLGTDLVVCYMPLGQVVEVINVVRR